MQPTVEAELQGVRRSLTALAADHALPPDVTEELAEIGRALQRVEKSWSRVLPYLASDNAAIAALLQELAPHLPGDLRTEVDAAVSGQGPALDPPALDVGALNERNEALRALLARAILASPPGDARAASVRARIVACLRQSLDNRPW